MLRSLVKFAYQYAPVRAVIHDYGPGVWRVTPVLRKHMISASGMSRLPGVQTVVYGPAEHVSPPRLSNPPSYGHELVSRPYHLTPPRYWIIPQAWLVGKHAAPITTNGHLLLSPFRFNARVMQLEKHPDLEQFLEDADYRKAPASHVDTVVSLVHRFDAAYGHWIMELCAQLQAVRHYEQATGKRPRILVRANGAKFIRESLAVLGVAPSEIIEWSEDAPPLAVYNLIVPSLPGNHICASPNSLRWLRSEFLKGCGVNRIPEANRRLYIPRRQGGWRFVLNDDEVCQAFKQDGWELVHAQDLSFEQQVRMFSEAQTIVGLHGAGLTNLLFAPRSSILEFLGSYGDGFWCTMSYCLGQPYNAVRMQAVGSDVRVDINKLRDAIKLLPKVSERHDNAA